MRSIDCVTRKRKGSPAFLLLAAALTLTAVATRSAHADAANYRNALSSTCWVLSKNSEGTSSGTGVLIDAERKLVVTNAHVVGDSRSAVIFFRALKNDRPIVERSHYLQNVKKLGVRGQVIAVDRKRDLALVEIDRIPAGGKAISLADQSVSPGEEVESVGNPGSTDALWVYTSGTVRAVYIKQFRTGAGEHDFTVVETQSPINSGDSGGPVVNAAGQLVAISQAIAPKARLVSYCVDISEVKDFLASPWKKAPLPVADVLSEADLPFEKHASGHLQLDLKVDDDEEEQQTVFIGKDVEYYERADVRKIWSLAKTSQEAPDLETTMRLLQQSARTKMGAWTVEKTSGGDYLTIYVVKIDATATPAAVKSTLQYVATLTAAMRKELSEKPEVASASDTLNEWLAN